MPPIWHTRVIFAKQSQTCGDWGGRGTGPGEFNGPAGIAVGPDGSIYVTDLHNHRVQRFGTDGRYLSQWRAGDDDAAPFGIAVDRAGRVHVTDLEAGRVSVWSAAGEALASWGTPGRAQGELLEPWGIAVDATGDVVVADHANHRIQRFSAAGVWRAGWGGTEAEEKLMGPMGLAAAGDGSVYVADLAGARIRRFSRDGALIAAWEGPEGGEGLPSPGLALDAEGGVYLVDVGRQGVYRLPGSAVLSSVAPPTEFALKPIAQPLGRGPVTLELAIPGPGMLRAEIFSLDGRRVRAVPPAAFNAGVHRITWDTLTDEGHRAPVGMYFVRVQFEDGVRNFSRSGRVVVLR